MRRVLILIALVASACGAPSPPPATLKPSPVTSAPPMSPAASQRAFSQVTQRVRPRAVEECKRRTQGVNCNFKIQVHPDPNAPVNAFQTVDKEGRPLIVFTKAMIGTARNADELAFVMGHEAAHHIQGHLQQTQANAALASILLAGIAGATGGNSAAIDAAGQVGALVGSRTYSKSYELEADQLGTLIAYRAGYDPLVGVHFFSRIPDPGDRFLGTHPPNASRVQAVQQTAQRLGLN